MRLTHEQIAAMASGVCDSEIVDGAWRPRRMPTAMRPIYEETDASRTRMACAAGVRLRFVSDTRSLRLGLGYGLHARPNVQGSIQVDDEPMVAFGPDAPQPTWEGCVFEQPARARRRFEVWLPHMSSADVASVTLDDGAMVEPAEPLRGRWLVYGDSITQGMTASLPHLSAAARCAQALELETLNLGVGGAIVDERLSEAVPDWRYDVASIAYGTNDFNKSVPVEDYQRHTRALVAALQRSNPGRPILLVTPLTWAARTEPNAIGASLEDYRASLAEVAAAFEEVALVPGEELAPDDAAYFVDRVHPNDAGFERYAQRLLPELEAAITRHVVIE